MKKKRFTSEEIYAMKTQVFEDNQAERAKYTKIAEWCSKKSKYRCDVRCSEYASSPDNPHIPYYYISIPMSQNGNPTSWIMDGIKGPTNCVPPVAGIGFRTEGWMATENIPDIGEITFYVCVVGYDA